jgi:hypothetical protein
MDQVFPARANRAESAQFTPLLVSDDEDYSGINWEEILLIPDGDED